MKKFAEIVFIIFILTAVFPQTAPDADLPWSDVAPKRGKSVQKKPVQNNGGNSAESRSATEKKENGSRASSGKPSAVPNRPAPTVRRRPAVPNAGQRTQNRAGENAESAPAGTEQKAPPAEPEAEKTVQETQPKEIPPVPNETAGKTGTAAPDGKAGQNDKTEAADTETQSKQKAPPAEPEAGKMVQEMQSKETPPVPNETAGKTGTAAPDGKAGQNDKTEAADTETQSKQKAPPAEPETGTATQEMQPKETPPAPVQTDTEPLAPEKDSLKSAKIIHKFEGGVTEIENAGSQPAFFAAGNDGFVTRYSYPDFKPDTWQLSRLPIKKTAVHPQGRLIAVYETDGFGIHQIALWDWNLKKRVFAKRLSDSVVSLTWSANGTYLFVGNRSIDGISVLDADGTVHNIYDQAPGIVFLAATAASERSIVTYGESGRLVYTDISSKKKLKEFRTENKLENPNLIKNFNQIIGYKNKKVFVINAVTGQTAAQYNANNAVFAAKIQDEQPIWLERTKRKNEWSIRRGENASKGFYLPNNPKITAARAVENHVIVGTDNGSIYMLKPDAESNITVESPLAYLENGADDITTDGTSLFVLNGGKIYRLDGPSAKPVLITEGLQTDRFKFYRNGFLLWSQTKKNLPIYHYSMETGRTKTAAKPKEPVISLSVYKDSILYVEPFNGVAVADFNTGKNTFFYSAAGIQNAVQVDGQNIIVSKSAIDRSQSPIFVINTVTQETAPITIEGELIFSLEQNDKNAGSLSCFLVHSKPSNTTELLTIDLNPKELIRSTFKAVLSYKEEDLDAFLYASGDDLLTNLGKNSLVHYNASTHTARRLPRPYSLPKRAVILQNYFVSLNFGGTVSWYGRKENTLLKTQTVNENVSE